MKGGNGMNALLRWIKGLLFYHAVLILAFFVVFNRPSAPNWMGSLVAFGLPTVQFTWSFTVGLVLGPRRQNRPWYWTALLLSFIPLSFVRILWFLAYHFLGLEAALAL